MVRERTRLVQRNLRMVLIVVDGHTDVAGLKKKIGDDALVEAALAELEEIGLIEPLEAVMARGDTVAEPAPTGDESVQQDNSQPTEEETAEKDIAQPIADDLAASDVSLDTLSDWLDDDEPSGVKSAQVSSGTGINAEPLSAAMRQPAAERQPPYWRRLWTRWRAGREEKAFERAYVDGEAPSAKLPKEERPRVRRGRINWPLAVAGGLLGIVCLLLAVILLFPYDRFRPDAEQVLSRLVQDSVQVKDVSVTFAPWPRVVLSGVTVGADGYATARTVSFAPDPGSWSGGLKAIREAHVTGLSVRESGLAKVGSWLASTGMANLPVHRLVVDGQVEIGGRQFGGLSATAVFNPAGGLSKWMLRNSEGTVLADAIPGPDGFSLAVTATKWAVPLRPGLIFDSVEIKARLAPGRLVLDGIDGQLHEGRFQGAGVLAWGNGAVLSVDLEYKHLAAGSLMKALAAQPVIAGEMAGRVRIDARSSDLGGLAEQARLDGAFTVVQGEIRQIDLAEVMRATGSVVPIRGGGTRFEQFSGSWVRNGSDADVRLSALQLSSGLMRATGQVAVNRNGEITGTGVVEMKGSTGGLRSAVTIGGMAADPELRAGR